ncbi:hypothetical protein ACFWTC_03255 [Streptomyces sp. NPDC058619]|uniref:hypothetical protein n=1 Tax=unclassified Streptomyces TaxID=2593676 RepID=UPI003651CA78
MANDVEIRVRVSNQSAGGLAPVNASMRQLRQSARDASQSVTQLRTALASTAAFDVSLNDRTETGVAELRARIAALRGEAPVRLNVEVHGDSAELATSARAMRELRTSATVTGTAMTALTGRAGAAAAALVVLRHAVDEAAQALRSLRGQAALASVALQELRASSTSLSTSLRSVSRSADSAGGRMDAMATRVGALRGQMSGLDDALRGVGGRLAAVRGNVGSLGSSAGNSADGMNKLLLAALALAPAIIPVAAAVAPVAAGLGAAGVAVMAFTAAVIPQIKALGEVSKAEQAVTDAREQFGRTSAQAMRAEAAFTQQLAHTPRVVQEGAAAFTLFKTAYKDWSDGLASDTLPVATKGFAALGALFPKLTPLVRGSSEQLSRFMTILAGGIESPGFDRLMARFTKFSTETLARANLGVVRLAESLASGTASGGIAEFMRFAEEHGPLVADTLGNLAEAVGRLLVAAAETGVGVLGLVNAFAQMVNAIPPELLARLVQLASAFAMVRLAAAALGAVAPAVMAASGAVAMFIRSARFAGVSAAIQGVTASLSAMQKSTVVLAVLTAVVMGINELAERAKGAPPDVDRLTTSLKKLGEAGKFTGELKSTFGDMDGFVQKVAEMKAATKTFDMAEQFGSWVPGIEAVTRMTGKLDELVRGSKSLSATKEDFKAFDEAFAGMAKSGYAEEASIQFMQFEQALRAAGATSQEIAAIFPEYQGAVAGLAAEQELAARSMGVFGEQAMAVQAKLEMQKQSVSGLVQSLHALNEVYLLARGGVRAMEAAIDAAAEALKRNGATLDENTEKGRANNQALDDLAATTMRAVEATMANGQGWEAAQEVWERGRGKLIESAGAMGMTEAQARSLANQILATPDKTAYLRANSEDLHTKLRDAQSRLAKAPLDKQASIRAEISDLMAKVRQADAAVNGLDDRTVFINTVYRTFREQHPGGQARAHGGLIGAAGGGPRSRMTLVGEQGPELVDLAPGSRVRSNPDSKRIADGMAGGAGASMPVLEIQSSGSRVDDMLLELLRESIRVRGGDVQLVLGGRRS